MLLFIGKQSVHILQVTTRKTCRTFCVWRVHTLDARRCRLAGHCCSLHAERALKSVEAGRRVNILPGRHTMCLTS